MRTVTRRTALAMTAICGLALATGCTSPEDSSKTEMSFTRENVYASLEDLRADSDLVVTVNTPEELEVTKRPLPDAQGEDAYDTEMTLVVTDSSTEGTRGGEAESTSPSSVTVIFLGNSQISDSPAATVAPGSTYALCLTQSGLGGEDSSKYFVTGAEAGILKQDGTEFVTQSNHGDSLPASVDEKTVIDGAP